MFAHVSSPLRAPNGERFESTEKGPSGQGTGLRPPRGEITPGWCYGPESDADESWVCVWSCFDMWRLVCSISLPLPNSFRYRVPRMPKLRSSFRRVQEAIKVSFREACQYIAVRASPLAGNSRFLVHSTSFYLTPLRT